MVSHDKMIQSNVLRSELLRMEYVCNISVYSPEMFVFVDETGTDRRDTTKKYGYSLRGKSLKNSTLHVRGERISAIACMSMNEQLDIKLECGTTDGDEYYEFFQTHLQPHLLPFNGHNHHLVVVMDNCSIYHVSEVNTIIN
uniref:Tc1-like transposase DDE domain-containing protein n=1 Tax=Amphimedon queenslandica TaxID=400682 RepID=A0A1X7VTI5_AMPQE